MTIDKTLVENASDPTVVDGTPGREQKKAPDMVKRILDARQVAIEQTATLETIRALNPPPVTKEPPVAPPGFQLTGTLDLGAALTKTQEMAKDLVEKHATMSDTARAEGQAALRADINEIKKALADPKQPVSPIQTYREIKELMEEIRTERGTSPDVFNSAGDLSAHIKLKELEIASQERQQKWQEDAAQRQRDHEWEMERWKAERAEERNRWETERADRLAEAQRSSRNRDEAMGHVGDLFKAWTGAVDDRMVGLPEGGAMAKVKSFACQQCHSPVPMVEPGERVTCPSCAAEYEIGAS